jgi:hypothetical protein
MFKPGDIVSCPPLNLYMATVQYVFNTTPGMDVSSEGLTFHIGPAMMHYTYLDFPLVKIADV